MEIQLVVYALVVGVYVAVRHRRGTDWDDTRERLGLRLGPRSAYLLAAGLAVLLAMAGAGLMAQLPVELLGREELVVSRYVGVEPTAAVVAAAFAREAVLIALGEEVFFRGLLAGALFRRLGFALGNLAQVGVFMLPHLVLLLVALDLWPIVVLQLAGAWVFGWLRWRSGSIWPGWLMHTLVNTAAAVTLMVVVSYPVG